ncbi:MAG: hypothetical protein ABSD50_07035 [Smithella sp.]
MKVSTGRIFCIVYAIIVAVCVSFSFLGNGDTESKVFLLQLTVLFPFVLIVHFLPMWILDYGFVQIVLYLFCLSINFCLLYGLGSLGDRWLDWKKLWGTIVIIVICFYVFHKANDIYLTFLNERIASKEKKVSSVSTNTQKLGLLVKPGDTPDQVNRAYHIPLSPEAPTIGYPSSNFLPQEGICFFFDKTGKIYKIRMESPFQSNVKGIKIGDSSEMVLKSIGEPTRRATLSGQSSPYIFYYTPKGLELRFDASGVVQTIFLSE